jgi:hypothetical protein
VTGVSLAQELSRGGCARRGGSWAPGVRSFCPQGCPRVSSLASRKGPGLLQLAGFAWHSLHLTVGAGFHRRWRLSLLLWLLYGAGILALRLSWRLELSTLALSMQAALPAAFLNPTSRARLLLPGRPGALHVGALHVGGAPSGGLIAGVSGPDAPDPGADLHVGTLDSDLELSMLALSWLAALPAVVLELASRAWMLRTLSRSPCRQPGPTGHGSPGSASSAPRRVHAGPVRPAAVSWSSPRCAPHACSAPLRWSSTWRLGLGCSGPGAPTFMWAARPDWTRFTKLCLLRAVPCA